MFVLIYFFEVIITNGPAPHFKYPPRKYNDMMLCAFPFICLRITMELTFSCFGPQIFELSDAACWPFVDIVLFFIYQT